MCALCGVLSNEHWAEDGGRRGRVFRARLLGRVLDHFGLDLSVWGGHTYVLGDRKGATAVVNDLSGLWFEAEKLLGRRLDPLDPALVRDLG